MVEIFKKWPSKEDLLTTIRESETHFDEVYYFRLVKSAWKN